MYKLLKRVVLSGHPGTGTSTLIEKLGQLYNLKPEQIIKVGDLFRQASIDKTGHDITGFYQREITEDLSIDQMQKELLSEPNPEVIFILESRLGGLFTKRLRAEGSPRGEAGQTIFPTVTVLITTKEPVRYKRVFERDHTGTPREIKEREEKDLKQWMEAHPFLTSNPLDNPDLYDFHIDNTNLDIDQTVEAINAKLIELGAVDTPNPAASSREPE